MKWTKKMGGIVFLAFLGINAWAEPPIRLGVGDWPPYLSEDLKHQGVVAHIITEVFSQAGHKVEITFYPWARAYKEAQKGRLDGTGVWLKKPEREIDFYYTDPVLEEQHVIFHLKSYPFEWKTIEDLQGIQIGGIIKFSYGAEFDAAVKAGKLEVHRISEDRQAFGMLLKGRIDVYPQEVNVGYYNLQKHFKAEEVRLITHHPKLLLSDVSYLLLSKKVERNKQLIQIFNQELKRFKESGKYAQYFERVKQGKYQQ